MDKKHQTHECNITPITRLCSPAVIWSVWWISKAFINICRLNLEHFFFLRMFFWRTSNDGAESARKICAGSFLQTNEDFTMYRAQLGLVWLLGTEGNKSRSLSELASKVLIYPLKNNLSRCWVTQKIYYNSSPTKQVTSSLDWLTRGLQEMPNLVINKPNEASARSSPH